MPATSQKQQNLSFPDPQKIAKAEGQIIQKQRTIDYDTKEFTVELLVGKYESGEFTIPRYQREFVWSDDRRCKFIESVLLGLPIPFLFTADTEDGILEIVDGAQRIRTLSAFMANQLRLDNLETLDLLNGLTFQDLPPAQQRKFKNRTLRMVVLSDTTTPESKFNIFERINTGSDALKNAELRKGAYPGPFYQLMDECAGRTDFWELCPINARVARRGERQELVLRYFAYSERYTQFKHDVGGFLNSYIRDMNQLYIKDSNAAEFDRTAKVRGFSRMLEFVANHFPFGFAKSANATTTPRVRFEAISVGVHLALELQPNLKPASMDWLTSREFSKHVTTHGSNSAPRLTGRVEFVRDALLGAAQ